MTKVLMETYGCTLNGADSDIMQTILEREGFEVIRKHADNNDNYDYIVINTCTVKKPTEQKIVERIRKYSTYGNRLVVAGCLASANREIIRKVAPRAGIISTTNIAKIAEALRPDGKDAPYESVKYGRIDKAGMLGANGNVIARIPISEGCLSSCSFCETKYARGPLKSFDRKLILKAVEMSLRNGAREIDLTSQDVGAYGRDTGTDIAELAEDVCDIEGDFKVRVGMLNPEHLPGYIDGLKKAYANKKMYKFIHLPVQSGSDRILRDMNRRYTIREFADMTKEFKNSVNGISIATDMIVGYPTETEKDFQQSLQLIEELKFSRTNISRFGAMEHAPASKLEQIDSIIVKRRASDMHRIARHYEMTALKEGLGEKVEILTTEYNGKSVLGRDGAYRQIALLGNGVKIGETVTANVYGNSPVCLLARV